MVKAEASGKPRKGCIFWGIISLLGVVVFTVVIVVVIGYRQINQFVEALSDEPADLPVEMYERRPPEQIRRLVARYDKLRDAIGAGTQTSVSFTADELNTLIVNHADLKALHGRLHFTIESDAIRAEVSYPADLLDDQLPDVFKVKGKYFNGSFLLQPLLERNRLQFRVLDASMKGKPIEPGNLRVLQQNDLRKSLEWGLDEQQKEDLRRFEGALDEVAIRDGRLLIRTRDTATPDPESAGP